MAKNVYHVSHIKSKQIVNGKPKLPESSILVEGEIAINFAEGVETISTKNESGDVVTFSSDNYYTEQKLGSGFTGENSGRTVTEALKSLEITVDQVIDETTSASTNPVATKAVVDKLIEDEETWAISLNELNNNKFGYAEFDDTTNKINFYKDSGAVETGTAISTVDLSTFSIDIDQVIDDTTSGSPNAVSTSAVYGFVTSYTPSITVDQVLDNSTSASTNPVSSKAVYKAVTDNELVWTNAFVSLSGSVSSHTENTEIHVTDSDKTNWNAKLDASDVEGFFGAVNYDSNTKRINFYNESTGSTVLAYVDATDFIKDGMVDNVVISGGNLVITFNTDSGKQPISIPLTDIFDPSNYYTKSETSGKTELSTAFNTKADNNSFTAHTADTSIHFTTGTVQTQIDNSISGKVNTSDIVTSITSSNSGSTNPIATKVVAENEKVVSEALVDLDSRKLDASAYTPTDLSNYYTKSETSGKTELSTAFNAKADKATTLGGYGITDAYTKSETSGKTELSTAFNSVNTSITDLSGQSETVAVALNTLNETKLDVTAYTPTDLSNYYKKSETSGSTELSTAFNAKADNNSFTAHTADTNIHVSSSDKTNWNGKFDNAKYENSGTTKVINFYSGNNIKATIDASDFIKDGMVDNVVISGGNLVITFNTDSGKQPISIPLTDIFNPNNYYTKSETSGKTELSTAFSSITTSIEDLSGQSETVAVALNTLNETKLDVTAYTPTDLSDYYTKSETSGKTEISSALGGKVDNNAFTAHTANSVAHITSSERTTWNNKVNASDVVTAITSDNSGSTNPIATSVIAKNEKVVSNALVSLDERVTDLTSQSETIAAALNLLNERITQLETQLAALNNN